MRHIPHFVGTRTEYAGAEEPLRGHTVTIEGLMKPRATNGGQPLVLTDDEDIYCEPVTTDDFVRVRFQHSHEARDVHPWDLRCFAYLSPSKVDTHVQLDESLMADARFAARAMFRSLDDVIADALAAHLRSLGVAPRRRAPARKSHLTLAGLGAQMQSEHSP